MYCSRIDFSSGDVALKLFFIWFLLSHVTFDSSVCYAENNMIRLWTCCLWFKYIRCIKFPDAMISMLTFSQYLFIHYLFFPLNLALLVFFPIWMKYIYSFPSVAGLKLLYLHYYDSELIQNREKYINAYNTDHYCWLF